MSKKQSSYRQIMKATSIFGGVQVFNIVINIIRIKFVAVLLGPTGMGIVTLISSTIGLIAKLSNFGLGTSAVKNISAASGSENPQRISRVAIIIKRLVWITGIIGAVLTLIFSSYLSKLAFGNYDYTSAFAWVSITLLINQISTGQSVVLRGLRRLNYLAQASMFGSILGLITTVPLYYFYGIDGIVPGIILTSISSLLLTWYFSAKIKLLPTDVSINRTIKEGKEMLSMGFMISLSGLIALGVSFVVRIFISRTGGVDQVGLYNAGFAIINSYVGMIFTAMSTDYFPRLSAVAKSNFESRKIITQQTEIAVLILSPVIIVFLVYINWVVILLYSSKFIEINEMILWAALGIFFKAVSWAMAFIFLAKGASSLFFWNELVTNIYLLILNLLGYHYYGLTGLGISFLIGYFLYAIQVYYIANRKYNFNFDLGFYRIFLFQFLLAVVCMIIVQLLSTPYSYFLGTVVIFISSILSYKELDKRLALKEIFKKFQSKTK